MEIQVYSEMQTIGFTVKSKRARLDQKKSVLKKLIGQMKSVTDQNDGKRKLWRKKVRASDPKHATLSVKQGLGNVMAWACMATPVSG